MCVRVEFGVRGGASLRSSRIKVKRRSAKTRGLNYARGGCLAYAVDGTYDEKQRDCTYRNKKDLYTPNSSDPRRIFGWVDSKSTKCTYVSLRLPAVHLMSHVDFKGKCSMIQSREFTLCMNEKSFKLERLDRHFAIRVEFYPKGFREPIIITYYIILDLFRSM